MNAQPQPDELRELLDQQAIREVLMRYCRGVDRIDEDLIAGAFHADATCEFGELLLEGDKIAPTIRDAASSYHLTQHIVGNVLIDLDGDAACSEAYFLSNTVIDANGNGGKQLRMRAGRYVDRFERRHGRWAILTRVVVEDWGRIDPLPDLPPGSAFRPGEQGRTDPLYATLSTLSRRL